MNEIGNSLAQPRGTAIDEYVSIAADAGEALVRRASVGSIAELDGIIFDVDGVLIDVGESIQLVHGEAARRYFGTVGWSGCENLVGPSDVDSFKLAGGFNSDWELAFAWMLLYLFKSERCASVDGEVLRAAQPTVGEFTAEVARRGGSLASAVAAVGELCRGEEWAAVEARWDRPALQRLFQEVYSGDLCREIYGFEPGIVTGPGLIRRDRAILDRGCLPAGIKFGIATGRTAGETTVGLRLMGWADLFPPHVIVSEDDGFRKPDPEILIQAVERLGGKRVMYVGDTPDDLLTVRRYNDVLGDLRRGEPSRMLACMVLTGLKDQQAKERFIECQADVVADNVNAALAAVGQCMGGALCPDEKRR